MTARGKMDYSVETRDRIKFAARKLFAERGVEAVTVRQIVKAAGAKNGGSLNYYFQSKEGLISELISDSFGEATEGWLDGLAVLASRGGARTVREIVEVLIVETMKSRTNQPPTDARFLASVLFTRRHVIKDLMAQNNYTVFARLLKQIAELRSDIPEPIMRQRLIFLLWHMISAQSAYEAYVASGANNPIWTAVDPIETIIDTAAALIEAPYRRSKSASALRASSVAKRSRQSRDALV